MTTCASINTHAKLSFGFKLRNIHKSPCTQKYTPIHARIVGKHIRISLDAKNVRVAVTHTSIAD